MNFCLIGGDLRNVELAKILAKEGNIVYTYGLEKVFKDKNLDKNIIQSKDSKDGIKKAEVIITSLPLTKDEKDVNMPLSEKKIQIKDIQELLKRKIVFTGNISTKIEKNFRNKGINFIDIMKYEEFAILNTIPTAEATIEIIIKNTKKVLQNSKCLIMGFGRIGKILSYKLQGLSLKLTCISTNKIEEAWGKAYGYEIISLEKFKERSNKIKEYDIIINTIPSNILKEELKEVRKDTLVIDLASKPFGIDRKIAKKENLNFIEALGLPRKNSTYNIS